MENKIAILSIVVNQKTAENIDQLNSLLHDYQDMIVGRMGIPYRERKVSLIAVIVDGLEDDINSLSGKLGMVPNVTVKTSYANTKDDR
ncbi:putative iron-only hydrogenase system regulator [Urinicoccus massiliensis]|uniref:Putative iron-only hydrogenase system regulator n=1 Tax=Urinicoccus massiliensis TaxID=1723382 RepID=A0A8H2M428_9FIRM|nr:TM1266 family iron-only hydrogenase system putative regulator [Urinicoccus massiliensis]KGF08559.1 iron-only hydrogenase system regulator [Tissierellia bacterium S5-A11]VFB16114.1 putative iron-only hydrogenase system regulator [Urinicoccus massiliensis]